MQSVKTLLFPDSLLACDFLSNNFPFYKIPCRIIFLPITIPCHIIFTAKRYPVERHIASGQVWEYPPPRRWTPLDDSNSRWKLKVQKYCSWFARVFIDTGNIGGFDFTSFLGCQMTDSGLKTTSFEEPPHRERFVRAFHYSQELCNVDFDTSS